MFNQNKKTERLGMLVAACIFGFVALLQFWRAATGIPVVFDGHTIPAFASVIVGFVAAGMAFWMTVILRHNRPVI